MRVPMLYQALVYSESCPPRIHHSFSPNLFLSEGLLVFSAGVVFDHGEGLVLGLLLVGGAAMRVQLPSLGTKLLSAFSTLLMNNN